jgi:DNA-binding MarR family transcriptional regulator
MKENHISEIRAFNRFYTRIIGLLDKYVYSSNYTLPEVRILFELYHHETVTASDLISLLGIDKGYLSRMILRFEKKKLLARKASKDDARLAHLSLTASGRKIFESLNESSNNQIRDILTHLSDEDCNKLVKHMMGIRAILSGFQTRWS